MKILRRDSFDYEPSVFELRFKSPEQVSCEELEEAAGRWYDQKQAEKGCACYRTLVLCHEQVESQYQFVLMCEWICEYCLPHFLRHLEESMGKNLTEVALGTVEE